MDTDKTRKVAVVTGSNKGIGLEIVKGLCKSFDGIVYLTARKVENGQQAIDELKKLGLEPRFHRLDVQNMESIKEFAIYLRETHGGLDVLVNNAGVYLYVILDLIYKIRIILISL
jgi:NAD(P)-dependent dehydrogenase (short-subunit alcohol dehydrogenase family)